MRIADFENLARSKCPDRVGNETILRPVSTADDVAGPSRRCGRLTKASVIGRQQEFGAALAGAVGVMASHWLVLAISPYPLPVFVALVACNNDKRPNHVRTGSL